VLNNKSREEIDELKDLNEAFLKDIGYEHMNAVCEEADAVMEKYKDIEVPKSLDNWFYGYLEEQKKEAKRIQRKKFMKQISRRVAAVVVVLGIVMSVVTLSVDAFRVEFFNMVMETSEKFGLVFFEEKYQEQDDYVPEEWNGYYPTFLPKGYSLLEYEIGASISRLVYTNVDGDTIELLQGSMISNSQIDTENANVMDVDINGAQGILAEKDNEIIIGWSEKNSSILLFGNLDKSTLLKVAENISKNK